MAGFVTGAVIWNARQIVDVYTLNRTGPRMDPWATPRVVLRIPDVSEPIRTYCLLSRM